MKKNGKKYVLIGIMLLSLIGIGFTVYFATQHKTPIERPNGTEFKEKREELENENRDDLKVPEQAQDFNPKMSEFRRSIKNNGSISTSLLLLLFSSMFSLSLLYFLLSRKEETFYKNKDKIVIYILGNIICIVGIVFACMYYINYSPKREFLEEEKQKEEVNFNQENIKTQKTIDLNKEKTDVTIKEGGTYTLTGSFSNSILVDAKDEEVELVLDNVEIINEKTATIVGLSAKEITLHLKEGTENKLTDGGNSKYDGCIFSNAELVLEGEGKLIINGRQEEGEGIATEAKNITINSGVYEITSNDDGINAGGDGATITLNGGTFYIDASGDGIDSNKNVIINGGTLFVMGSDIGGDAGIDTDTGYEINGGFVIALGSDMIEVPKNTSEQNTLAFTLDRKIDAGTLVTLMKEEEVIASFKASKSFKTLIISKEALLNGKYKLYTNGNHTGTLENGIYTNGTYTKGEVVKVNNQETFTISNKVNTFGKMTR